MSNTAIHHDEYMVIGATENTDDMPLRLRPVLRTHTVPYSYALLYEDDEGAEVLVHEDEEFILQKIRDGSFYELPCPVPSKPKHWLLRVRPERPPEYIPAAKARERLLEIAHQALVQCARAVERGDRETARKRAGDASLARPDEPFAVLARIALWRPVLSESQMRWEMQALEEFLPDKVTARFAELRKDVALAPLIRYVENDPLADLYSLRRKWLARRPKSAPEGPSEYWECVRRPALSAA